MCLNVVGEPDSRIDYVFCIFSNSNRSYPQFGTQDFENAAYRTHPLGCMDTQLFNEWLKEPVTIKSECCLWIVLQVMLQILKFYNHYHLSITSKTASKQNKFVSTIG